MSGRLSTAVVDCLRVARSAWSLTWACLLTGGMAWAEETADPTLPPAPTSARTLSLSDQDAGSLPSPLLGDTSGNHLPPQSSDATFGESLIQAEDWPAVIEVTPLEFPSDPSITVPQEELPVDVTEPSIKDQYQFGDWFGYNTAESDWSWIPAGNDLGIFSIQSHPRLQLGEKNALRFGMGFHFLNGPVVTDMPPRLFDFEMAFLSRSLRTERLMLDFKVGVGAFSDFEGSARKGIRFPSHAVLYHDWTPDLAAVIGVEVLDRDDISVLPVAGFVWRPAGDIVAELVFPRPRIQMRVSEKRAFYLGAELGGDSWAIERQSGANDVATYRDLRIACGLLDLGDAQSSVLEVGYAFGRSLEYRSGIGDYDPDGALMLRWRTLF